MKRIEWILLGATILYLAGCGGEASDCENYFLGQALDQNSDGITDYRYLFMGDSILAYHDIDCKSVGHQIGKAVGEQILSKPVIGARIDEILRQYTSPPEGADYDWVIMNGGINDLTEDPEEGQTKCNCNGDINVNACMTLIDRISTKLSRFVNSVNATSQADIALLTYYPPETESSFIGACFPYVDLLNDRYRQLAKGNSRVWVIESFGEGIPVIEKISQYGLDQYHPTALGSNQLAEQIISTLDLPVIE